MSHFSVFQDLPNNMIHQVAIHSLPQEWLWCETWCSDTEKPAAKTIDLVSWKKKNILSKCHEEKTEFVQLAWGDTDFVFIHDISSNTYHNCFPFTHDCFRADKHRYAPLYKCPKNITSAWLRDTCNHATGVPWPSGLVHRICVLIAESSECFFFNRDIFFNRNLPVSW